jgi:hypothetical protein
VASLGFRVKTGWTAVVLLDGPSSAPRVLDARRIDLCDPEEPDARQPYHAGFGTFQEDDAEVARLVKGVRRYARGALARLLKEYGGTRRPATSAVVAGSDVDPARIANLHMRAHALEGRLYRTLVEDGMRDAGVPCAVFVERELPATAAGRLGLAEDAVKRAAGALGKARDAGLDGPWRTEEKAAAIAAWLTLKDATHEAPGHRPRRARRS